jgi:peroxisomal membrane protein 4
MSGLDALLLNPALHDYLAIVKGARNGFVYGVKVRAPHALIMAILFGRGEYVCPCNQVNNLAKSRELAGRRGVVPSSEQQRNMPSI